MKQKLYNLLCDATHVLLGGIIVYSSRLHWTLPVIGALYFYIYEMNEEKWEKDSAYKDIREFLVGFFVTIVILLIWR